MCQPHSSSNGSSPQSHDRHNSPRRSNYNHPTPKPLNTPVEFAAIVPNDRPEDAVKPTMPPSTPLAQESSPPAGVGGSFAEQYRPRPKSPAKDPLDKVAAALATYLAWSLCTNVVLEKRRQPANQLPSTPEPHTSASLGI